MTISNVAILGAGAVGVAIAHQLFTEKPETLPVILADGDRADRYRQKGFTVNGTTFHPTVARKTNADLVILATKSYHIPQALTLLDESMGENTLVMSLLNGIASEKTLGERYGHEKVIPAMILGIDAQREDASFRYLNPGRIFYGQNPAAPEVPGAAAIESMNTWFERCGLGCVLCDNITANLWHKFMINVGINQTSALMKAPYAEFQKEGRPRELMLGSIREVVELSKLEETGLEEKNIEEWLAVLATLDPTGLTSMAQDARAGRRMEVDLFADTVIELAERHGLDVPINRMLQEKLTAMQPI